MGDWLASDFWSLGFHFQNWMPLALAILAFGIFLTRRA